MGSNIWVSFHCFVTISIFRKLKLWLTTTYWAWFVHTQKMNSLSNLALVSYLCDHRPSCWICAKYLHGKTFILFAIWTWHLMHISLPIRMCYVSLVNSDKTIIITIIIIPIYQTHFTWSPPNNRIRIWSSIRNQEIKTTAICC